MVNHAVDTFIPTDEQFIEPPILRHTNVSQPQLLHASSTHSISASEDFHSLSGSIHEASEVEFDAHTSRQTVLISPPTAEANHSSNSLHRQSQPSNHISPQTSTMHPTIQESFPRERMEDEIRRGMTPGADDTPLIHFALDQLTRDVEVMGTRRYPGENFNSPLVSPLVPLEHNRTGTASPITTTYDANYSDTDPDTDPQAQPISDPQNTYNLKEKEVRIITPPQRHPTSRHQLPLPLLPQRPLQPRQDALPTPPSAAYDHFVPYVPSETAENFPPLVYLPCPLRPASLLLFLFFITVVIVLLIFTAVWSSHHNGLLSYLSFGDAHYFLFEYVPQLTAMLLLIWLFHVQNCLQRIAPYLAMASDSTTSRSRAAFLPLYPLHFLFPQISYFKSRQFVLGAFLVVSWLSLFTVPLSAAAFNVRWFGDWKWLAVSGVIWSLLVLYIILALAVATLAFYFQGRRTGLKWDPRSIADVMTLLGKTNISGDYADSEVFKSKAHFKHHLWSRSDRLGYWHTSRDTQHFFYGLGEEGGAIRRYSVEFGRMKEMFMRPDSHKSRASTNPLTPDTIDGNWPRPNNPNVRDIKVLLRYIPKQLSLTARLAYMLIALALLVAFFVVSFVNKTSIRGFSPLLQSLSNVDGFSSANFLYSFLPCLIGMIALLLWQPLDQTYRYLAPYNALYKEHGALARDSLLLDLPFTLPIITTIKAIQCKSYLVAITSFFSLTALVLPVLSGGVFWAQYYPNSEVRVAAEPKGFYALCAFLVLYAMGYIFLMVFGQPIALPHGTNSLAELLSWLYMSPLVTDRNFINPPTRAEMIARLETQVSGVIVPREVTKRRKWHERFTSVASPRRPIKAYTGSGRAADKRSKGFMRPTEDSPPPRLTVRLIGEDGSSSEMVGRRPESRGDGDEAQTHNVPVARKRIKSSLEDLFSAPFTHRLSPLRNLMSPSVSPRTVPPPVGSSPLSESLGVEGDEYEEGDIDTAEALSYNATAPLDRPTASEKKRYLVPPLYAFGVFLARDGKEHLGIERTVRAGRAMTSAGKLVATELREAGLL